VTEPADELQAEVQRDALAATVIKRTRRTGFCTNCGKPDDATHGGRCNPCRKYLQRNGVERPRRFWR
jgi:NADH pyrophosphatase NudC (nudix superfamily)